MAIEQLDRPHLGRDFPLASPPVPATQPNATPAPHAEPLPIARVGLQLVLGYEWLVSGLDKLLYGHFPAALGGLLAGVLRSGTVPAPLAALLRAMALPHPLFFGWLIEWSETLAGLALIAAALAALLRPALERRLEQAALPWMPLAFRAVDALALAAAAGSALLGLSFYLLDGVPAFWPLPSIAFGGAVDAGLLLAALTVPLLLTPLLAWLRRGR
jgi:hypothetical protein